MNTITDTYTVNIELNFKSNWALQIGELENLPTHVGRKYSNSFVCVGGGDKCEINSLAIVISCQGIWWWWLIITVIHCNSEYIGLRHQAVFGFDHYSAHVTLLGFYSYTLHKHIYQRIRMILLDPDPTFQNDLIRQEKFNFRNKIIYSILNLFDKTKIILYI